jgi:hypothetical protein
MTISRNILLVAGVWILATAAFAQAQMVTRTITKTDRFDFGAGGTVAITGAPVGSITIKGSRTNEIEITATIKLTAASESDLNKLAEITGFVTDEGQSRTVISTIGTHTKQLLKKAGKKIPKNLMGLPFRVDYVISVPRYCDLEVDSGSGDLTVTGVEGSLFANLLESNAVVELSSGSTVLTIGKGSADVSLAARGWRGRSVSVQVGSGDVTAHLPTVLSADIDAVVLRSGSIDNTYPNLKPRDRHVQFSDKSILAKAGVGGPQLKFSVGDGHLRLMPLVLN